MSSTVLQERPQLHSCPRQSHAPIPIRGPSVDLSGGVIPVSAGQTADPTVDLSPGRYAWVSHSSIKKGMMKTFTVE